MNRVFSSGISRRSFIRITSAAGTLVALANPLKLFAGSAPNIRYTLRGDLLSGGNPGAATGISSELINFAQVSDVHITDIKCPLRLENLKWFGIRPAELANLDDVIDSLVHDQSDLSSQIWNSVIRSINRYNEGENLDFLICTGDHTDTDTENELSLFVEIADGVKSATFEKGVEEGSIRNDFIPEGLDIPWYTTLGNHDVAYVGVFNSKGILFNILAPIFGARRYLENLSTKPQTIESYRTTEAFPGPIWHGFSYQPLHTLNDWQGYYSFSPKPHLHCIVLNTANFNDYNPENPNDMPKETFSLGVMDKHQYQWMVNEIESNQDKLCLVFSHHPPVPDSIQDTKTSFMDNLSDIKASELRDTLCRYENVIAHINGHSHINRIIPVKSDKGGYWNINTCALIEWPMEWRNIKLRDNGDGTGSLLCSMIRHEDEECLDVAAKDKSANPTYREGSRRDRNAELLFSMPESVSLKIIESHQHTEGEDINSSESGSEGSNPYCFIATAAFGSDLAPEVIILRHFRDIYLKKSIPGRLFIRAYYRLSPPIARYISDKSALRSALRALLKPFASLVKGFF